MLKTLIAGLASSVMALPQMAPATLPPVTNSTPPAAPGETAPLAAEANTALLEELSATSTTADRFRVLAGDPARVQERLVFDFNRLNMPAPGAKGKLCRWGDALESRLD